MVMPRLRPARFRARVFAYHHGGWRWAYHVTMDAPWATKIVAGRAQFGSQPEALAGALATLRNLGTEPPGCAYRAVKTSACDAADTCTLDEACPFAADCRRIEAS